MDIFEILKQDHEKVKGIFEKIEKGKKSAKKTRQTTFDRLCMELEIHMKAEEDIFYSALKQHEEAHDKIIEAIEEHHVARLLLNELKHLSNDDERWDGKMMVLKENVEHHISEEEENVFDMAKDLCDEEQLDDIAKQFQADKKQIKAHA